MGEYERALLVRALLLILLYCFSRQVYVFLPRTATALLMFRVVDVFCVPTCPNGLLELRPFSSCRFPADGAYILLRHTLPIDAIPRYRLRCSRRCTTVRVCGSCTTIPPPDCYAPSGAFFFVFLFFMLHVLILCFTKYVYNVGSLLLQMILRSINERTLW